MRKLIIAIDGPAGSGKSTTAIYLARKLKLPYIDTGAMYRAVTLKAMQQGVPFGDTARLAGLARGATIRFGAGAGKQKVYLDGRDVTKAIRDPDLTQRVFYVARQGRVRKEMVKKQRAMGRKSGAVMEGRDIGTVVFPRADYKFYFEASQKIRARRRYRDFLKAGRRIRLAAVLRDQRTRDRSDIRRKEGPLRRAKDAFVIDTTSLTIKETADRILRIIKSSNPLAGRKLSRLRTAR